MIPAYVLSLLALFVLAVPVAFLASAVVGAVLAALGVLVYRRLKTVDMLAALKSVE